MDLSTMASDNPEEAQKLWDEMAAERGEGAPTAARPPAKPAPVEAVTIQQPAQETPSEVAPEEGKDDAPAAATAAAQAQTPDPLQELTQKYARLEEQLRTVHGHIGGLTSGQNRLREMLNSTSKAVAAEGKDAPTQAQIAKAMEDPEEWKQLCEVFPEYTAATEKKISAHMAVLQQEAVTRQAELDRKVEERVAKETAAVRTELVNSYLDSVIDGDWLEEVNTERFSKWLDAQPAEVKALADSSRTTDAAKMLRLYQQASKSNSTQQIIEQRQAKMSAAVAPRSNLKAQKSKAPEDMTPQELWNYEAAQRDRQRSRA